MRSPTEFVIETTMRKAGLFQAGLLGSFLIVDISKSALLSWSHSNKDAEARPTDFNVIFTKDLLCTVVSFLWLLCQFRRTSILALRENVRLLPLYLPIALLFLGSQNAAFASLQLIDMGTFKLLVQACTPTTAVLSFFILHKRFNQQEILSIVAVFVFSLTFYLSKTAVGSDVVTTGVLYALAFIVLSSIGGVVSEKVLKAKTQSLTLQYFYSKLASLVVSTIVYSVKVKEETSFFQHFDYRTLIVIVQFGISGFVVTAITKLLSSTAKNITQASSAAVAQLLTVLYPHWMHKSVQAVAESNSNPVVVACAIGVVGSVVSFHLAPRSPEGSASPTASVVHQVELGQLDPPKSNSLRE